MSKPFIATACFLAGMLITFCLNNVIINFRNLELATVDLASQAYFYGCISQGTSRKACQLETERYNAALMKIYE